jgi:hypothetical protein
MYVQLKGGQKRVTEVITCDVHITLHKKLLTIEYVQTVLIGEELSLSWIAMTTLVWVMPRHACAGTQGHIRSVIINPPCESGQPSRLHYRI